MHKIDKNTADTAKNQPANFEERVLQANLMAQGTGGSVFLTND